ncbi:MAG TPA: amino acid adenylation domain-containing protein, partial [Tahibacter sp.]|uniref:non-ribosomal peptide synthetase n=1 Tax=Tahibacter sp. TaxID=2056211 RepID=UPI002C2C1DF9
FLPCRLDASLSARVRAASRRFDTTPFVLLLTSWALLLSRLSGQDDLVVGVPSANRSAPETQDLVGLLVSTLPLRVPLNGAPRLSLLLKRVERRMLDAQQHQDIAFEKIVELVCSTRSLAYNPLFQVLFAWQGGRPESLRIDGLTTTLLRADCSPRHAKFDLSLLLFDDDGVIHGGIEYASALFDAPTIERCRDHWFAVLAQLVQGEDIDPQRVELLAPAQRNELLDRWNATARDFPRERCLHELVEAQAAETPDAIALEFEAESLTYAELDRRAARLAARLRSRGATVGSFVAIHIARSPAMIVAVLAVLKAGAAYVPLDTLHPSARKAHILDDCRPGWLLHAGDAPVFERLAAPPQAIDVSADDDGDAAPAVATASTQLAYLIYTSGSTGLPKGVMVEHRSVVNRLVWMLHHFPIEADDAVLQKTALGFDVSVWEIFVPLICGARLVLADSGAQADPERLARILRERRITVVHFVPSMLHLFLAQLRGAVFPDLHHVICSGEELPRVVVEDFQHRLPRTALYNLYGPTEASIEVSWHRCELDHGAPRVPIGRPIDNCRLYVLDRHHRLLPPGVTGELFIGGTPVARGYFRRPALTSERFLPDPLTRDANARMYKTGDQARWLPNGEVDFLGRNDAQIKLRGFRIEPSEIETQLARFPGVEEAAVALHQDATRGASLVGYWVGDAAIDAAVLRDYLGAAVPDYMVPTFFVRLDRLPLNANGKLDRAALPAPDTVRAGAASAQAFEGELEHRIAAVWHEVLGRSGFGRDDNFFAVGGHSLLTLRLRTRLAAAALPVEIADLFR